MDAGSNSKKLATPPDSPAAARAGKRERMRKRVDADAGGCGRARAFAGGCGSGWMRTREGLRGHSENARKEKMVRKGVCPTTPAARSCRKSPLVHDLWMNSPSQAPVMPKDKASGPPERGKFASPDHRLGKFAFSDHFGAFGVFAMAEAGATPAPARRPARKEPPDRGLLKHLICDRSRTCGPRPTHPRPTRRAQRTRSLRPGTRGPPAAPAARGRLARYSAAATLCAASAMSSPSMSTVTSAYCS